MCSERVCFTMQGFTLAAITDAEKKNFDIKIHKVNGPRNKGQGERVKVRV